MDAMILKFVASARAAGLRVSTAEVLDCLRALHRVDVLDEAQFATALRANFAKSRLERERFDALYGLFFHELREDLEPGGEPLAAPAEDLGRALLAAAPDDANLAAFADFLLGAPEAFLQLVTDLARPAPSDFAAVGSFGANLAGLGRGLAVQMALNRVPTLLDTFLEDHRAGLPWETRAALEAYVRQRLQAARRILGTTPPRLDEAAARPDRAPDTHGALGAKPFANLTAAERLRMRDAIATLVRKLRDSQSRRHASRSRGTPDLKKTLRAAMRTQGIPLVLKYRRKPPRKARILALCDISASVWSSARFTLTTLYSLQDCFQWVRSFVFIDEPVEVTRLFKDHDIDIALQDVLTCQDVHYDAATDYGRVLHLFKERHLDAVNKKTTLIIIGDGRTNYRNPADSILEELRARARRVLWLNPEARPLWYSGDSVMRSYEPYCNEVRQCQNLNQLAAFFHDLVL